jgi:hypothetical protein
MACGHSLMLPPAFVYERTIPATLAIPTSSTTTSIFFMGVAPVYRSDVFDRL